MIGKTIPHNMYKCWHWVVHLVDRSIFSGFKSQCIMPASFMTTNACKIYEHYNKQNRVRSMSITIKKSTLKLSICITCFEKTWTMLRGNPLYWFILISSYLDNKEALLLSITWTDFKLWMLNQYVTVAKSSLQIWSKHLKRYT